MGTPERGTTRRLFRLAQLAATSLGFATLLFVLLEVGTRVLVTVGERDLTPRAGIRFPTEDYHPFFRTVNPPGPGISRHPEFHGWRILPAGADPADEDALRILFLGGSTTAGRYPQLVVERLESRGVPAIGFNAGAPMHTSLQSLYKLWTYADWTSPDLVVVLHNVNDLAHGFTAPTHALPEYRPDYSHASLGQHLVWDTAESEYDGRPVFRARPKASLSGLLDERDDSVGGLFSAIRRQSTFLWLLVPGAAKTSDDVPTVSAPMEPDVYLRSLPAFERNMRNIKRSCAALDVPVVFLTMPVTTEAATKVFTTRAQVLTNDGRVFLSDADFLRATRAFNAAIRELVEDDVAWVCDLAPRMTDPGFFQDECHLTPAGLRREASLLAKYLTKEALLRKKEAR